MSQPDDEWRVENINAGELYLVHVSGARARMSTESTMSTEILLEIPDAPEGAETFRIDSIEPMRVARGAGVKVRGRHAFVGALSYFGPSIVGLYVA